MSHFLTHQPNVLFVGILIIRICQNWKFCFASAANAISGPLINNRPIGNLGRNVKLREDEMLIRRATALALCEKNHSVVCNHCDIFSQIKVLNIRGWFLFGPIIFHIKLKWQWTVISWIFLKLNFPKLNVKKISLAKFWLHCSIVFWMSLSYKLYR